ncbi:MAG: tetratricopeptide repeat protein [Bacteroidia bacterium]
MYRFFLISFVAALSVNFALAQTNLNPALRVQEKVYQLALENGDLEAATGAVYQLMALQPERTDWQDTLCLLYHGRGYYLQSAQLANRILKQKADNEPMMEVLAQAYENLGNYQEAMLLYDKLLKKQKNPVFMYKRALMQYSLRYYTECEKGILEILRDESADKMNIATQTDLKSQQMNMVPVKAATLNVLGVMYMDMGLKDKAEDAFKRALELHSDYPLVKDNLEKLKSESAPQ